MKKKSFGGIKDKTVYLENIGNFYPIKISNNVAGYKSEQISLDKILKDLAHINLIKIDIEGSEVGIIETYYKQISKCCDNILLEIHNKDRLNKIEDKLASVGFRLVFSKDIGSHIIYLKK